MSEDIVNNNFETYSLLWLDDTVKSKQNIHAQQKLRSSINHLKMFEQNDSCEQYIRSLSSQDRVILIITNELGQQMVPRIHQLRQVSSIYVYFKEPQTNHSWANQFSKVKSFSVQFDELIDQIQFDQSRQIRNKVDEPISISIFNTNAVYEQSTSELNGQFVHSQLLIDSLLRMKSTLTDKNELVSLCQKQYHNNDAQLLIVREFEQKYSSDQSLWWYTRETFLYRLLNKALRVQNIDLLFVFRFFIRDVARELNQHRCTSRLLLYRGQLMSNEELQALRDSIGQLISMSSFLSTTVNRPLATFYLGASTVHDNLQRVLFEIDANPCQDDVKPFANISSFSNFPGEEEVLMMLESIFRLNNIHCDKDQLWIIRMTLCSDNDHDLKMIFNHMKNQLADGEETSLLSFGHVLRDMGKFDEAEKYYCRLLNELPPEHEDIANCYYALGRVTNAKGDYDASLDWHKKSLELKIQTLKSDDPRVAYSYNSIGVVYWRKNDNKCALESYEKALMILKRAFVDDDSKLAMCFNNMGIVYQMEKKYSEAFECYQKALAIWKKYLPTDSSLLGQSHNNIGEIHHAVGQCDLALEYYRLSLESYKKSLPSQHPEIARTFRNIGLVHEKKGDFQDALTFYEKSAIIRRKTLLPSHPEVIQIEKDIKDLLCKLK